MVGIEDIEGAAHTLKGVAHRTPMMRSRLLDAMAGGTLHFKMESLQRSGAFKFRGAYNALYRALPEVRETGVITASSGNHGGAVALAAHLLQVRAVVVMPEDAIGVKVAAIRGLGAEVQFLGLSSEERMSGARERCAGEGLFLLPPYDHPDVIAGQGTAGLEILEQVPDVEVVLVPCGGGGLLSGIATAIAARRPEVEVWGVEATAADDTCRSFAAGRRIRIAHPDTIADGMRNLSPGELTFPLIQQHVRGIALVEDSEIQQAMALCATRMKVIAEPTGAAAPAAALTRRVDLAGRTAVAVISGGNVDPGLFARCLEAGSA